MIDLGAHGDVPDGGAIRIAPDGERESLVVVREGETIAAYVNRCPHFRIPLDVGRGIRTFRNHVLCANHYAAFRFADGLCVEGPCLGASLERVAIAVDGDRIGLA